MESGRIVVFNNFDKLSPLVAFVYNKEIFVDNDFKNESYALIALKKNTISRAEVPTTHIKPDMILTDTVFHFTESNSAALAQLHSECRDLGYDLSWLETMQIFFLQKYSTISLLQHLKNLEDFYGRHIK